MIISSNLSCSHLHLVPKDLTHNKQTASFKSCFSLKEFDNKYKSDQILLSNIIVKIVCLKEAWSYNFQILCKDNHKSIMSKPLKRFSSWQAQPQKAKIKKK